MTLHQKVHQEIPLNNELSVAFAMAFAYEHYKIAKEENNPKMYRVAWAVAGEASVERCRKMGSLQQKMNRFGAWQLMMQLSTLSRSPRKHHTDDF